MLNRGSVSNTKRTKGHRHHSIAARKPYIRPEPAKQRARRSIVDEPAKVCREELILGKVDEGLISHALSLMSSSKSGVATSLVRKSGLDEKPFVAIGGVSEPEPSRGDWILGTVNGDWELPDFPEFLDANPSITK